MYDLVSFDKWTQSCDRHYNYDAEEPFPHPKKVLVPFRIPALPHLWSPATAALSSVAMVFPFLEFYMKGIVGYVVFSVCLFFT